MIEFDPILEALGWDGLFDLEIFSDADLSGSLWREEPSDVARRGVEKLRRIIETTPSANKKRPQP